MELQMFGMINNLEEFELRLRAAGGNVNSNDRQNKFKQEEYILSEPSTVQSQIRLVREEGNEILLEHEENWALIHEVEVLVDKDDAVRVCSIDRIKLEGNANAVLTSLGFTEEFQIGRYGDRVILPGNWIVEYFHLYEPTIKTANQIETSEGAENKKRRRLYALENKGSQTSSNGWLVSIKKQYQNEKETQPLIGEGWKLIRRLMPALQIASCASLFKSNYAAT